MPFALCLVALRLATLCFVGLWSVRWLSTKLHDDVFGDIVSSQWIGGLEKLEVDRAFLERVGPKSTEYIGFGSAFTHCSTRFLA